MKRGIVELTDQEISYLLQTLEASNSPLINKLHAAVRDEFTNSKLELSEHELESIMDALPAPGITSVADELRLKLANYFKVIALEQKLPLVTSD
jgi:hypothetical protein